MPDPVFLTGDQVPDYLRDVELMTAGIEWQASTGPVTITLEHIADAITACNEDPHIQPPRIKLGHTSELNGDHPNHDPFAAIGDAEPAFGIFANLKATNDGAVLVGDADRILTWLALSAPAAYPNRSAEATWQVAAVDFDVQTAGGKRYSMVVTAVSLLGVYAPAISDLEDLKTLIMDGPSAIAASTAPGAPASVVAAAANASMSVSWDTIWERSLDWLRENKPEWPYAWTRDVRVDPSECIVDDDQGHLWALPFSTDGGNTITYGPALMPKAPPQFPDAPVPVMAGRLVASFARPAKSKPQVAAGSTIAATERPNTEGVEPMDDRVREFLVGQGHDPETASEAQVQAAVAYVAAFPTTLLDPQGEPEGEVPETLEAEAEPEVAPEVERVPVAASKPDPIQAAKDKALTDLSAEVASLRAERDARLTAETKARRDAKATAAIGDKITPAEFEHYRGLMEVDEDRTDALLAALPSGRVPLSARAEIPDPSADSGIQSDENGLLPANVSLLTPTDRAALAARRRA